MSGKGLVWLVVFNVPSTARSFRGKVLSWFLCMIPKGSKLFN